MKYAILSDIHGNWHAMAAVLKDAKAKEADAFLFAGDYCMCSPKLNQIVQTILEMPYAHVIAGNGEGYLRSLHGKDQTAWTDGQYAGLYWCYQAITKENHAYLDALPETLCIAYDKANIYMAHSSNPFLGEIEFRHLSSAIIAQRFSVKPLTREALLRDASKRLLQDADFQQRVNTLPAGVYVFGHTHVQWHAALDDKLFINAGSCGQSLDGQTTAAYTLLEERQGQWYVQERRVAYDVQAFIADLKSGALYENAQVWCDLVVSQCLTGVEHMAFFLQFAKVYAQRNGDAARPFSRETWAGAYKVWYEQLKHVPPYMNTNYLE